jgi:DinB superfamily
MVIPEPVSEKLVICNRIEPFYMKKPVNPEYWLRGPVPGIAPLLQPVAHALLQSREEVNTLMDGFPAARLWDRPAGLASPGFHLQHLAGVLDRLFTYAGDKALSPRQLEDLAAEGKAPAGLTGPEGQAPAGPDAAEDSGQDILSRLLKRFNQQIDKALQQLGQTPERALTEHRGVGRAKIPSTLGGLLFHAAEHTMRHTGQLLVTAMILQSRP